MSDTHLNTSSEPTAPASQKSKKKNWIVAALGLVLVILGSLSVFQTDSINNLAIEIGSKTMTQEMVEAYPEHAKIWEMVSEVLESSIKARTTSPDALTTLISTEIDKAMGHKTPEIKEIL
jgi:phosphoribosylformimino-5-aminoimidazole carboxamide ribonucleotide (ProFAR) isomerase